jgi:hypothetical protein
MITFFDGVVRRHQLFLEMFDKSCAGLVASKLFRANHRRRR